MSDIQRAPVMPDDTIAFDEDGTPLGVQPPFDREAAADRLGDFYGDAETYDVEACDE